MADVLTFLGIVLALTVTPGADMALLMRHVLAHGFRAAWPTIAGIETGLAVHIILCVTGLSLVLSRSDVAFTIIQFGGAAWLAWLGLTCVLAALAAGRDGAGGKASDDAGEQGVAADAAASGDAMSWRRLYLRGFVTNLLNVKIMLFYIAFLPQFAPRGDSFALVALGLAAVQLVIGLAWLLTYAAFIARAGTALERSPRVRRWFEGATGAALMAFGARLATVAR